MANRFVDFVNGLDANNGAGPDASDSTNKPWKTITKALGASGAASGDVIYLSPAGPFRETVTVALTPAAETKVIGDYANAQGFKTSGGVRVAPGPVIHTAYTTSDKTAPSASRLLDLNGKNYLTFQNLMLIAANTYPVYASGTMSQNIKFLDCAFTVTNTSICVIAATFGTTLAWTFDRCIFSWTTGNALNAYFPTSATGADYDVNVLVQNCLFISSAVAVGAGQGPPNTYRGGGVRIRNCTMLGGGTFLQTSNSSTTIPCTLMNSSIMTAGTFVSAGASGQITEDYNVVFGPGTRSNVTAGTHSIVSSQYAPLIHFGQERIWGGALRMFGEPMAGSPLLGFGNDGSQTAYDLRNNPRPAGGASALPAAGALERANTFAQQQSVVHTGANAIGITGPGYQDFLVPVDATATTFSIWCRYDSTYAGTLPQIALLANGEIGVAAQTVTADASGLNAFSPYLLAAFTPTAKGVVTFRVISNDTNGGGHVYFDTFAAST